VAATTSFTLAVLTGAHALLVAFGLAFLVSLIALLTPAVRRNSVLLATCLVIVTLGICGAAIAGTMYAFVNYK
jgi:uncharacterized membrane protein YqjE